MPDLAVEDDRRPLRAPARRARLARCAARPRADLLRRYRIGRVSAKVFVITGPSGVGKGTLITRAAASACPELELSVSATTASRARARSTAATTTSSRPEEFERRARRRRLPRARHIQRQPLRDAALGGRAAARRGASVVLEIEVQGARQVRAAMPEAVQIFIAPPDPAVAARAPRRPRHGLGRGDRARLEIAEQELEAQEEFRTWSSTMTSIVRPPSSRGSCAPSCRTESPTLTRR